MVRHEPTQTSLMAALSDLNLAVSILDDSGADCKGGHPCRQDKMLARFDFRMLLP